MELHRRHRCKGCRGLEQLVKKAGGMDLFLYASGVGKMNPNLEPEPEEVTLHTNALGFTRMVGAAYRYFARQGHGHIAVISSIAGIRGLGPSPSYSATKALQSTYIEALEQQSHAQGINIRFTDIRPDSSIRRFSMVTNSLTHCSPTKLREVFSKLSTAISTWPILMDSGMP